MWLHIFVKDAVQEHNHSLVYDTGDPALIEVKPLIVQVGDKITWTLCAVYYTHLSVYRDLY